MLIFEGIGEEMHVVKGAEMVKVMDEGMVEEMVEGMDEEMGEEMHGGVLDWQPTKGSTRGR
jgi:hypothetical protein